MEGWDVLSHQRQSLPARLQDCRLMGITQSKAWFAVSSPKSFWPQKRLRAGGEGGNRR